MLRCRAYLIFLDYLKNLKTENSEQYNYLLYNFFDLPKIVEDVFKFGKCMSDSAKKLESILENMLENKNKIFLDSNNIRKIVFG